MIMVSKTRSIHNIGTFTGAEILLQYIPHTLEMRLLERSIGVVIYSEHQPQPSVPFHLPSSDGLFLLLGGIIRVEIVLRKVLIAVSILSVSLITVSLIVLLTSSW
jgi:hypothetical protein